MESEGLKMVRAKPEQDDDATGCLRLSMIALDSRDKAPRTWIGKPPADAADHRSLLRSEHFNLLRPTQSFLTGLTTCNTEPKSGSW